MLKQYKICRRLGARVFSKCENPKFVLTPVFKRGSTRRRKQVSEFGLQLLEKQKVRYSYGLRERQFVNYVKDAMSKKGNPVEGLFRNLELRLDNVIYRLGLAKSRPFARQVVSHGHIIVNSRKITIPSYRVRKGDIVAIRKGSQNKKFFAELEESLKEHVSPTWLYFNTDKSE